jgi:excisionase family DNA binding protein
MSIQSTGMGDGQPLVVSPRTACRMLACGLTRLYELIATRELESYRDGSVRRITTRSISAYIERQLDRSQPASSSALGDTSRQSSATEHKT